ncbi:hypothetical protein B0H17DRAFT_1129707 [Mycena rosella]|uniref:Uncharacterized protein n=1 Tax=Mycena rosella TaxID=1033263 RepID=A0AAD7GN22_MYCRO|nr:hypothetical protein B0H17DRAFT_1129707 [Mycena rosella]
MGSGQAAGGRAFRIWGEGFARALMGVSDPAICDLLIFSRGLDHTVWVTETGHVTLKGQGSYPQCSPEDTVPNDGVKEIDSDEEYKEWQQRSRHLESLSSMAWEKNFKGLNCPSLKALDLRQALKLLRTRFQGLEANTAYPLDSAALFAGFHGPRRSSCYRTIVPILNRLGAPQPCPASSRPVLRNEDFRRAGDCVPIDMVPSSSRQMDLQQGNNGTTDTEITAQCNLPPTLLSPALMLSSTSPSRSPVLIFFSSLEPTGDSGLSFQISL